MGKRAPYVAEMGSVSLLIIAGMAVLSAITGTKLLTTDH
jgi:hypothetical protein